MIPVTMTKIVIVWSFVILLFVGNALLESPVSCGLKQPRMTPRIVHGYDTEEGDWPWHAAIYQRKQQRTDCYACGGTLISEQFVVTASHCVFGQNNQQLPTIRIFVRLGVYDLNTLNSETLQQHAVQKICHPRINKTENLKNDIALLKLATLARFNDFVQPACISSTKDLTGQLGTVVGWGVTEDDKISDTLRSTRMPVIDPLECLASNRDVFGATLDVGMFCAGYTNGTSVCNGDSGGGMFFENGNVWYLGGIVSFTEMRNDSSTLCRIGGYAAFTKVFNYLPWISSITEETFPIAQLKRIHNVTITEDTTSYDHCEQSDAEANGNYIGTLLPRNCGVYNTNRIANGRKTKVFQFPWMASLQMNATKDEIYHLKCAGTLINSRYVLTTATCVVFAPDKVILGDHTLGQDKDCNELDGESQCAPPVREYGIESTIRHQEHAPDKNDIGLIRLDGEVNFADHIQPICLPATSSLRALQPPWYIATGWGEEENNGNNSPTLLQAKITPANLSICQQRRTNNNSTLYDSQLCVAAGGTNGSDVCYGDHGGPLGHPVKCNGMRFVQFGIISETNCRDVNPSTIQTNVSSYMSWIVENMQP